MKEPMINRRQFIGAAVAASTASLVAQQGNEWGGPVLDIHLHLRADDDSNLTRMAAKGLAKKDDFRIISKSDLIPNSPYAYLADLPPDLKAAIAKAFADAPTKAKAAFDKLSDGKDREFVKVDAKAYEPVVELIKFIDSLRKQKS